MKHLSQKVRRGTTVICPWCGERVVLGSEEGKYISGRCNLCQKIVTAIKD